MNTSEVHRWLLDVSGPQWFWFAKVLSGNDTLLNSSHQAGPYFPKSVIFNLFPSVGSSRGLNPRRTIPATIDSHAATATVTAIWYNSREVGSGTRNETRITGWGGRTSPLLDPESTGSLCVFAFLKFGERDAEACRIWLARNVEEEEVLTSRIGSIEPGLGVLIDPRHAHNEYFIRQDRPCRLSPEDVPSDWLRNFPSPAAILARSIEHLPSTARMTADDRLLARRACEFELFRCVEELAVLPRINKGFESVDVFVDYANAVTNRRKARSGISLELHLKAIFDEEGVGYSHAAMSEHGKRPDFLFPSVEAYRDTKRSADQLRMLGVKTTVKDRWRQVIDEAERLPVKHLLTLQEGVSISQLNQMRNAGIRLVVPRKLHSRYPKEVRSELITLASFIEESATLG